MSSMRDKRYYRQLLNIFDSHINTGTSPPDWVLSQLQAMRLVDVDADMVNSINWFKEVANTYNSKPFATSIERGNKYTITEFVELTIVPSDDTASLVIDGIQISLPTTPISWKYTTLYKTDMTAIAGKKPVFIYGKR